MLVIPQDISLHLDLSHVGEEAHHLIIDGSFPFLFFNLQAWLFMVNFNCDKFFYINPLVK